MGQEIRKIIEDAVLAPSGENCQPWRFVVSDNVIEVYNRPEADQSLYNFEQKGSYVAHGALLTNLEISAREHGFSYVISIFPNEIKKDLVARVELVKDKTIAKDILYPFLSKRCTNRKEYSGQKLDNDTKRQLLKVAEGSNVELYLIDDQNTLQKLGTALSMNERMLFENRQLHDFFYQHLFWQEEEQNKSGGFYFKTLEFLPHQLKGVRLFKNWLVLRILNKMFGISKMIAKENAHKYAKSGSLMIFVAKSSSSKDIIETGQVMQRAWLVATKLGLAAHPCTGVLYFMERLKAGNGGSFSDLHKMMIKKAYGDIEVAVGVTGKTIPMLMRIGFANEPSARSTRCVPDVKYV